MARVTQDADLLQLSAQLGWKSPRPWLNGWKYTSPRFSAWEWQHPANTGYYP